MDINVGDELQVFVRQPGFHHWNRYAAVNDEFVPIHMDDEAGRAAGYPSAFGQGNLQWAYLHNVVRTLTGDDGKIERITCSFRGANVKGQTVTARGRVTGVSEDGGRRVVDLEVWTENEAGERLAPGTARVSLPRP
jgi:acyl dehydratase